MDYFTAAGALIKAAEAQGIDNMAPIPYWENMFPDAAFDGYTATQNMATLVHRQRPGLHHGALGRRPVLRPGVQQVRRVLVLQQPVRLAGRAELAGPVRVQRAAAQPAQAVEQRVLVRLQLHAGSFEGSCVGG